MKYLLFILGLFMMASCGHFHDEPNVSVWAGGMWLLFWIPFLGSLYLGYRGYRSKKTQGKISVGLIVFAAVLQMFSWGVVWFVNSPNWA